ncbi:SDR family oxidoreductase [Actinomadura darangshiensis]|uniref:SDR family oxidoreductase n=1 Tax=Actinomadura darangshiensis TaxID=705336 RepID=A0A4R5BTQ5_9ACTN|nr:SDR family NAD(P)-dependent oxidoreductase [Actinomadura darangshiensis]TDD88893.1 SDR family oxidoreductase [Actinomadura darangshiensis]
MDLRLTGKTAVVTGASKGIGLATVEALTAEGMRVVAASRTITPALKETGAIAVPVDLSVPEAPARLIEAALDQLGGIDVLVNNVGGGDGDGATGGFLSFDDAFWQGVYELNLFAAVRVTRAAMPSLLERSGAIVNVSSNAARVPHLGPMPYTTAKAALTAFGKALAGEFGPRGVRVNTVSPGVTRTAMWESPDGYGAELAASMGVELDQLVAALPDRSGMLTGRIIEPAEVAALIAYLASPLAASIVGADHTIDAGVVKTA